MDGQLLGRVTWFNEAKGYGEIITEDKRVFFFTYREIYPVKKHRTIKPNTFVKFTVAARSAFQLPVADRVTESKAQLELGLKNPMREPEASL